MTGSVCGDPSETFERYALGLARREGLAPASGEGLWRRQLLLLELARLGVRGWPSKRTLTTSGRVPDGCRPCLEGRGSNLCITTRCNRDCFFCFNPRPRADGLSVHGRPAKDESEAAELLSELDVASIGLSGGEPLIDPDRALRLARALRAKLGPSVRIDLYTNGDLLTRPLIRALRQAGVGGLRVNLAARAYDPAPVALALEERMPAEVEIPVVPQHEDRIKTMMEALDALGAPHLILHELFVSAQNLERMRAQGLAAKEGPAPETLSWAPVSASEEAAYRLMIHALKKRMGLSVYYCSCGTQEWIAQRALERARRPGTS